VQITEVIKLSCQDQISTSISKFDDERRQLSSHGLSQRRGIRFHHEQSSRSFVCHPLSSRQSSAEIFLLTTLMVVRPSGILPDVPKRSRAVTWQVIQVVKRREGGMSLTNPFLPSTTKSPTETNGVVESSDEAPQCLSLMPKSPNDSIFSRSALGSSVCKSSHDHWMPPLSMRNTSKPDLKCTRHTDHHRQDASFASNDVGYGMHHEVVSLSAFRARYPSIALTLKPRVHARDILREALKLLLGRTSPIGKVGRGRPQANGIASASHCSAYASHGRISADVALV
jgi:hypothetical protein